MTDMTTQEKFYLEAKQKYYLGVPVIEDWEFDELEKELKEAGSNVPEIVGFDDRNLKFPHPTGMLSLSKLQADKNTGKAPVEQAEKWLNDHVLGGLEMFFGSPKYDGNAVNIVYKDGKLHLILSRGDGEKGRDYTPKLRRHVPLTIPYTGNVEVRAEVVIERSVFEKKYSKDSKNERNFVAGVLNRKENDPTIMKGEVLDDLVVMAHEGKITNGMSRYIEITELVKWGFNGKHELHELVFTSSEFQKTYNHFKDFRENGTPFLLDGFVIKTMLSTRETFGLNNHDPNWAIAIKFPPVGATTETLDLEWRMGKTGNYTPVVQMTPVHLDGTTVRRASAYNYGFVIEKKLYPGAFVKIAKAGDIIPQVIEIIKPGKLSKFDPPTQCFHCGTELEVIDGKHLRCVNDDCKGKQYENFVKGIQLLKMFGVSSSTADKLWRMGLRMPHEVLSKTKVNEKILLASGLFQPGRSLEKFLDERSKITEVQLELVLLLGAFKGMGRTTSKQIAKQVSGMKYSYDGLEKAVVEGFQPGGPKYIKLLNIINDINLDNVRVVEPKPETKGAIKFEMTGSPKSAGFNTKADFIAKVSSKGWVHSKINDADYLVTDNPGSSSGKMKQAVKHGVQVITYKEAGYI